MLITYAFTFIKDKENLANTNLWSGSDYLKTITVKSINTRLSAESSVGYSTNGERCYKLISSVEGGKTVYLEEIECNCVEGDSYHVSYDLFVRNTRSNMYIVAYDENHQILSSTNVAMPKNSSFERGEVSMILPTSARFIQCNLLIVDEGITYLDNVKLINFNKR